MESRSATRNISGPRGRSPMPMSGWRRSNSAAADRSGVVPDGPEPVLDGRQQRSGSDDGHRRAKGAPPRYRCRRARWWRPRGSEESARCDYQGDSDREDEQCRPRRVVGVALRPTRRVSMPDTLATGAARAGGAGRTRLRVRNSSGDISGLNTARENETSAMMAITAATQYWISAARRVLLRIVAGRCTGDHHVAPRCAGYECDLAQTDGDVRPMQHRVQKQGEGGQFNAATAETVERDDHR